MQRFVNRLVGGWPLATSLVRSSGEKGRGSNAETSSTHRAWPTNYSRICHSQRKGSICRPLSNLPPPAGKAGHSPKWRATRCHPLTLATKTSRRIPPHQSRVVYSLHRATTLALRGVRSREQFLGAVCHRDEWSTDSARQQIPPAFHPATMPDRARSPRLGVVSRRLEQATTTEASRPSGGT